MSVRKRVWTDGNGLERSAWVVDYRDAGGKRRNKQFDKKKDATAFAASATVEVRDGTHVAASASSTVAAAGKLWIKTGVAAGLERSTIAEYQRHLDTHIVPYIGSMRLSAITIAKVRAFEEDLLEAGRSPGLVKKVVVSLGSLVSDAQERGLVARNVVRDMKALRGNGEARTEKRHKARLKIGETIPAREEVKALLGVLTGRWRPLILTAAFCGLRASELRGLQWGDVNFERGEISVHRRADRYNALGRPKSATSERVVPAPPMVINALKEWKLACPKGELGLVFPNGQGRVETLGNIVKRGLHPAWIAAGVTVNVDSEKPVPKYGGLHVLRHFYASWLINRKEDGGLGMPPKVVQERMGHSSIMLTMDRYSHLFPRADDRDEMAEAERAFLA